jgi:AraC family transcriptional activator of pobA
MPNQSAPVRPGIPVAAPTIPRFALYGEAQGAAPELLHIEDVHARSSQYQWEISPHLHQGLYQVLWVRSGTVSAVLDEQRQSLPGPVAIVVPPAVVHGFQFAPGTDGWVLTLSSRFLSDGDFQTVGAAFEAVFAAPRVLDMRDDPAGAGRLDALMRELGAEFAFAGAGQPPPTTAWLARALLWRLAQVQAAQTPPRPATPGTSARRSSRAFWRWWKRTSWPTGPWRSTRSAWACPPRGSTAWCVPPVAAPHRRWCTSA